MLKVRLKLESELSKHVNSGQQASNVSEPEPNVEGILDYLVPS